MTTTVLTYRAGQVSIEMQVSRAGYVSLSILDLPRFRIAKRESAVHQSATGW